MLNSDGTFNTANPFVRQISRASGIDATGRPIYNGDNRPGDPSAAADGAKGEQIFAVPSFLGGKNWMPMSCSQKTGLFYVPSNERGMDIWNEPITCKKDAAYLGAGFTIKPEGKIVTLDDETGAVPWRFQTGSGIVGQPVTWEQDGEQFVSVVSGWGGAVWTFKLPMMQPKGRRSSQDCGHAARAPNRSARFSLAVLLGGRDYALPRTFRSVAPRGDFVILTAPK